MTQITGTPAGAGIEGTLKLFRTLIDQSNDAIEVVDPESGRFLDANAKAWLELGYSREEFFTLTFFDVDPSIDESHFRLIGEQLSHSGIAVFEGRHRRKDGSEFPVEVSLKRVNLDRDYVVAVARNITERKRVENENALFVHTLRSAKDCISITDQRNTLLFVNDAFVATYGYTRADLLGKNISILRSSSVSSRQDDEVLSASLEGGWHGELLNRRKDGTELPVELWTSVVKDEKGTPVALVGIARDITDRKRSEEALSKERSLLRALMDNTPDHIYFKDADSRFIMISKAQAELFGLSDPAQAAGRTDFDFFTSEHAQQAFDDEQKIIRTEQPILGVEEKETWTDRPDTWVSTTKIPLCDEEGKVVGTFGISRDITEQKRSVRALKESEERLRLAIKAAGMYSWERDIRSGRIIRSGHAEGVYGGDLSASETNYSAFLSTIHPADRTKVEESMDRALRELIPYHGEFRIVQPDGKIRWLESHGQVYADRSGKPMRMNGVTQDVTDRKQVEEALEAVHDQLKYLFDSLEEAIFSMDVSQNKMLLVSPAHEKVFGHGSQEFFKNPNLWYEMILAKDKPIIDAGYPILRAGKSIQHQFRILHPDGRIRWIEAKIKPSLDACGSLVRVNGIASDISERKEAEEALELQDTALRAAANAIMITDREGNIVSVNQAFCQFTGYSAEEAIGKKPSILKSGKQSLSFYQDLWKTVLAGKVWKGEVENKRKDGSLYTEELTITPVRNASEEITHFIAIKQDVTEQKKLRSQLIESQKVQSIGTLAGGIAHDFNNILGIILGHIGVVERAANDPTLIKDSVDEVTKAVQRGASLVRQILTFARKTDATMEPVNVNAMIKELSKMIETTFPKTIGISLELQKSISIIFADQTQLHQVLLNLCVNARDAITDTSTGHLGRGEIKIKTSLAKFDEVRRKFSEASAREYICISVSDSGKGMDEATKQKIFEPFFTTKGIGEGTGLGLSVVYGVVSSHRGFIDVESEVGKGTTFKVYFPVSENVATPVPEKESRSEGTYCGKETILLAEDEKGLRQLMKSVLEREGYTVLTAVDGLEAIRVFSQNKEQIAIVLTDIGLPKLDGSSVFAALKDIDPKVKIILTSGYVEPNLKSNLLRSGAKEFLQKPYSPNLVIRKIREVLDNK